MIWTLIHVLLYLDAADIDFLSKSLVKEVIVIVVVLLYFLCLKPYEKVDLVTASG